MKPHLSSVLLLVFSLICFLVVPSTSLGSKVTAAKTILILNQVRGEECCDSGSIATLKAQTRKLEELGLSASFLLRYDALTLDYKLLFEGKSNLELGLFLEITPTLAQAASVPYRGPVERWYKAENAYLLGYLPSDRIKLIDTAMQKFKQLFGYYPRITAGWMIDSQSLRRLQENYGVSVHQITRDQWGTDSYTLYGGPIGPSYIPSRNWPLLPQASQVSLPSLALVRQTISDPVWNYGDSASVFTSQPNDYMKGGKGSTYFEKLLDQALSQKPEGLAVVGLESSMPSKFQTEFFSQLEIIKKIKDSQEVIVPLPQDWIKTRLKQGNPISTYLGKDGNLAAVWVNAPQYRLRFFFNDSTHSVILTDLRIYNDDFIDPYAEAIPATPNAYWVVPFVIDASRYSPKTVITSRKKIIRYVKAKLNIFDPCLIEVGTQYEGCTDPEGIKLPPISSTKTIEVGANKISYQDLLGRKVELNFVTDSFSFTLPDPEQLSFAPTHPVLTKLYVSPQIGVEHQWIGNRVNFMPYVKEGSSLSNIQSAFPEALIPEVAGAQASLAHSTLITPKKIVELNRNPIRVVAYLRDTAGNIASPGAILNLSVIEDPSLQALVEHPETSLGEYFLDLTPKTPGWYTPVISLEGESRTLPRVLVVPNCFRSLACIKNPMYLFKWMTMLVLDRIAH